MGVPTGEKGVLKLVYPGGYMEIHTEPITAAEVMRKNPRHCVARPDVFKFPYIVVRPESVLFPGRVFYVVPNRTIYHLLKARGELHNQPPKKYDHHHQLDHQFEPKQTPFHKPWAGTKPKHQDHNRCIKKPKQVWYSPWDGVSDDEEDSDEGHACWAWMSTNGNTYQEFKYENSEDSMVEIRSTKANRFNRSRKPVAEMTTNDNRKTKNKFHEQVNVLKSCLRRHNSVRKSSNLRVTFAFPITTSRESPALQQSF